MVNSTVVYNGALAGAGGGLWLGSSNATVVNCIVWYNEAVTGDQIEVAGGSPLVSYCSVEGGWPGPGNILNNPQFAGAGNYRLSAGSPCIDAGCNCGVLKDAADLDGDGDKAEPTPLDLDNEGRFFDDPNTLDTGSGWPPVVDMGAYEFGSTGAQPCIGDLDNDRDVGLADLAQLLGHYGMTSGAGHDEGDLDCDGDVDLADLAALLSVYGTTCD